MDDAPAAPRTNLVALRDRREQVIASLTDHFTADVLDLDEFDARVEAAHRATTIVALDRLVEDLAPLPATAPHASTTALTIHDNPSRAEKKAMTAIFSGFDKGGAWIVPRVMKARCVMGGGRLDFRDADFAPGVTELHVTCIMGGLEIIVPPQLAVDCDVAAVMGGVDHREAGRNPDPGRAILRITGTVVMGGLDIQTRLSGETRREARRRSKRERHGRLVGHAQRRLTAGRAPKDPPDGE
jgi:hypothetical protein